MSDEEYSFTAHAYMRIGTQFVYNNERITDVHHIIITECDSVPRFLSISVAMNAIAVIGRC